MTEITQADRDVAAQYDVVEAFARHREAARMEERAAIVAWLREEALERMRSKHEAEPMTFQYFCREAEQRELEHQADNFEAGEHLK